jgi:phage shock protein PspC (stress-responsive transcriptional regulator)
MNKTVTINISGIIFHIEEDAYEALSKYLAAIKKSFAHTEGGNEIMSDIESRIAELLQSKISASKQVVFMADVVHVMEIMGQPEEFAGDEEKSSSQSSSADYNQQQEKIKRRLFRDPDDKAIGGVCSGLAAYFDIDTVWVRLAMFLLIFFGGLSLWVYVILWIVMPEARTTADKFAMRGEPANINTIFKSFKEEAEDVKTRMNKYGRDFRDQSYGSTVRNNVSQVLQTVFNIAGRLFGLFLFLIGAALLVAYVASLMGISIAGSSNDLENWKAVIFDSPAHYALGVFAFIIVIGIPIMMLVYGGIKLLFRVRYTNRWLNVVLGILWSVGFAVGIYITAITVKQFKDGSRAKETVQLRGMGDTIVVKINSDMSRWKEMNFDNEDDIEHHFTKNNGGFIFGQKGNDISILGYASLNIVYTESDSVELVISRSSKGQTKREANEIARSIQYHYEQTGNTLSFDKYFMTDEKTKFRAQELELVLRVPKGKVVKLDHSVQYFLDDVENTSNTWDGDMAGRRWKMTDRGLDCIDCENLDHKHKKNEDDDVTINEDGIQVKSNDAEIKIDENGIKIHTPEKDVNIGSEVKVKSNETKSEK